MKKSAIIAALVSVVAISTYFLACTGQKEYSLSSPDSMSDSDRAVAATLMESQFADVLTSCISEGSYEDRFKGSPFYGLKKPYSELNARERLFLDGWITPGHDAGNDLITTLSFVEQFYYDNHRFPENGGDLLSWWLKHRGVLPEEFAAMSPDQQLRFASFAVNVITGKLFSSYTATEWEPGAIYLRVLSSDDELDSVFDKVSRTENFKLAWRLIVYGDDPGEIIMDKTIIGYYPQQPDESQGSMHSH